MAYDHKIIVQMEGRTFIVHYDADGEVLRINERKKYVQFGVTKVYDISWWNAKSHVLGTKLTMPKRVIELARQKMAAEDRSLDATP